MKLGGILIVLQKRFQLPNVVDRWVSNAAAQKLRKPGVSNPALLCNHNRTAKRFKLISDRLYSFQNIHAAI